MKDLRRELEALGRTNPPQPKTVQSAAQSSVASTVETKPAPATGSPTPSVGYTSSAIKQRKFVIALAALLIVIGAAGVGLYLRGRIAEPAIESIAVLPFVNESNDPNTEYLSDGITESIISNLSQLPQLKIMARATVFRFKGKEIDPQTVGQKLNVRSVLTGRLLQQGDSLVIRTELVDVADGSQLWGTEYNRKLSAVLALQQDMSREISERLRLQLTSEENKRLTARDTTNAEAYQYYLRGRYFWNKRTADGLRKAIEQFQQAIDRDPNYALGYVGLADSHLLLQPDASRSEDENYAKAEAYAERALQIDDSLAEAHTSLAGIDSLTWKWEDAERNFQRAIDLNPNYPTAHYWRGVFLQDLGRFDEALTSLKRAQELDPLSRVIGFARALVHLGKDDVTACIEQAKKTIDLDPNYYGGHAVLGHAYLKQRLYREALEEVNRSFELSGNDSQMLGWLGYGYAVAGQRSKAFSVVKELEEKYRRQEAGGTEIAEVYIGLGDHDQAFAWLDKDVQARRRRSLREIRTCWWIFGAVKSDPRYTSLLKYMGLSQ